MQKTISGPAQRYAQALSELASEKGVSLLSSLEVFEPHLVEGSVLGAVLANPTISVSEKQSVLLALAGEVKAEALLNDFLSLLCVKGRAGLLSDIISCYRAIEYAANSTVVASVASAAPLTDVQREQVSAFIKSKMNAKQVELEEEVDASLLAGVKVRTGSIEFDATVRGQLNGLRAALK